MVRSPLQNDNNQGRATAEARTASEGQHDSEARSETETSSTPLPIDLEQYTVDWLINIQTRGLRDSRLWKEFGRDFRGWRADHFQRLEQETRNRLLDHLRSNGVYVSTERNNAACVALQNVVLEERQARWPEADLEEEIETGRFNSRLNPYLQEQAYATPAGKNKQPAAATPRGQAAST
jgi:hypothetical protein